jgi:transposase
MKVIGCDYHPSFQQIAMLEDSTGEMIGRRLSHRAEAEAFYRSLAGPVRVGLEASGNSQWFERLLAELGHEVWIGDAAQIRASVVRRQKTDARDAAHLLRLMIEQRFPRIWVPSAEQRDLRQLLLHRHKLVRLRTQVKNQLQHLALNQGVRRRGGLWSTTGRKILEQLTLPPWTTRRRDELLRLLDQFDTSIQELDRAVAEQADARADARRLMQDHVGVGSVVALAYVLTLGPVQRFRRGKQVASYLGLAPREDSSSQRQRLGAISKQGNPFLRMLLVQAAHVAVRYDAELRRRYYHLALKKNRAVATVAIARLLAVRLYWTLRRQAQTDEANGSMQGSPSHSVGEGLRPNA